MEPPSDLLAMKVSASSIRTIADARTARPSRAPSLDSTSHGRSPRSPEVMRMRARFSCSAMSSEQDISTSGYSCITFKKV